MKIIHTADVHLNASPDKEYPWEAERSASLWAAFKRLVKRVQEDKADIFLICGDLFHGRPSEYDLKEINYLFSTIPETTVVLCAGNHDHMGGGNPYCNFGWSKNVIGLWSRELMSVSIPQLDTRVYGLSYYDNEAENDLYSKAAVIGSERYHILLLHGGDLKHSPIKKERLASTEFDYIAMGHIHKNGSVIENKAVYCGALTPIDRNDIGEHGYIEAVLNNSGISIRFVPFSAFEYKEAVVYCDESDSLISMEDKIRALIEEEGIENSYKLIVKGSGYAAKKLQLSALWDIGHVLEISDRTFHLTNIEELRRQYKGTLLEEYINELNGRTDAVGRYALTQGVRVILEIIQA